MIKEWLDKRAVRKVMLYLDDNWWIVKTAVRRAEHELNYDTRPEYSKPDYVLLRVSKMLNERGVGCDLDRDGMREHLRDRIEDAHSEESLSTNTNYNVKVSVY